MKGSNNYTWLLTDKDNHKKTDMSFFWPEENFISSGNESKIKTPPPSVGSSFLYLNARYWN